MTAAAGRKASQADPSSDLPGILSAIGPAYETSFLDSLAPALEDLARHGIKIAANAGSADPKGMYDVVVEMVKKRGLKLKVRNSPLRWLMMLNQ